MQTLPYASKQFWGSLFEFGAYAYYMMCNDIFYNLERKNKHNLIKIERQQIATAAAQKTLIFYA